MILAGNGSDDLLTIITRSPSPTPGGVVVAPTPSYILYQARWPRLQDARLVEVPFRRRLVARPRRNSPSPRRAGSRFSPIRTARREPTSAPPSSSPRSQIGSTCPLVVDEAYADFADGRLRGARPRPLDNVIVTRTFSKGYSLAGLRLGYLIARPEVVEGLIKVKDSYNCDASEPGRRRRGAWRT